MSLMVSLVIFMRVHCYLGCVGFCKRLTFGSHRIIDASPRWQVFIACNARSIVVPQELVS